MVYSSHPASFRFHLTMDTLAFGYILPTTGRIRDFNPLETCAARRTTQKHPCMDAWVRRTAPRTARFDGFVRHRSSSSIISYSILAAQRSTRGKLCVPVGQPGLTVIYSRKISSEVKMQIPRCQVLQAQYLWHDLRFLRMPCLQRPLQFSPKGV